MKELLLISGLLSGISVLFSVVLFLYGLFVTISGKFKSIEKKRARTAGVFLIGQLFLSFLIAYPLHNALDWGYQENALQSNIGNTIIFLIFGVGALFLALFYARKNKQTDTTLNDEKNAKV
jgi:hypothetical protein